MALYKILGQSAPAGATPTDLYVVPTDNEAIASSVFICNRSATADTFRVSCSVDGAATANKDYIYYDVAIGGNDTFVATVGLTFGGDDVVRVYSANGTCSFTIFGNEI
jgi:hypothetical protein